MGSGESAETAASKNEQKQPIETKTTAQEEEKQEWLYRTFSKAPSISVNT
tara:strand:+ start:1306 stop:1455 length:150 start_codon:yes stop_codon:yes gene_type:complete